MLRVAAVAAVAALVGLVFGACGNGDDEEAAGGGRRMVEVSLTEWAVIPQPNSAPPGRVTFDIRNPGEETHEFVVIKTDLDVLDLPTAEDGSVDEEAEDLEVTDEVEEIAAGDSASLSADLQPGKYVLICNIVEEEEEMEEMEMEHDPSHFQSGMRADFIVE